MLLDFENFTVENAEKVLAAGQQAIRNQDYELDFGKIKNLDSSAVAVALAWERQAKESGRHIRLSNVSEEFKKLTDLYAVSSFLK